MLGEIGEILDFLNLLVSVMSLVLAGKGMSRNVREK